MILNERTTVHERLPRSDSRSTERMLDLRNPLDGPVFDSLQNATQWAYIMRDGDQQAGVPNPHGKCRSWRTIHTIDNLDACVERSILRLVVIRSLSYRNAHRL